MKKLHENIKNKRIALGLTQDELAQKLGYKTRSSINKIEKGLNDIPRAKIEEFARALGTTAVELLNWDTQSKSDTPEARKEIPVKNDGKFNYDLHILAEIVKENGYEVEVFKTSEEATKYIHTRCSGKTVGIGESVTLAEIGLVEKLKHTHGEDLYISDIHRSRDCGKNAMTADVYISGPTGISYDTGEMVIVSERGSRVAGTLYYSDEIILVFGKNKIAGNLSGALELAKKNYAPKASRAHGFRNPCVETGECENCNSPDRACRFTCIHHKAEKLVYTTVVLIDEILGY
jgi:transcriptional regulator with XRE-family HTH domain